MGVAVRRSTGVGAPSWRGPSRRPDRGAGGSPCRRRPGRRPDRGAPAAHPAGGGPDGGPIEALAPCPAPGWRDGYDPAERWLIGHQLFFALIQGAIAGLNCFSSAWSERAGPAANEGLELAAAFMRSSAAAMKFASDFDVADYDRIVRPDMAPPRVRQGFSGLQTRDHAYLVRLFGALKPVFAVDEQLPAQREFVEAVVSAYAAHEFICSRFRGDVLPSLRMAAASRGKTERPGADVVREMMRARLSLVDPGRTSSAAGTAGDAEAGAG